MDALWTVNPLHPDNKVQYQDGDRIKFLIPGDEQGEVKHGRIVGIASSHVIDHYIVEPFEKIGDWSCWSIQHPHIRPETSNLPFLCKVL